MPTLAAKVVTPAVPDVGVTDGATVLTGAVRTLERTTFDSTSADVPPEFDAVANALK